MKRTRHLLVAACACMVAVGASACGSDDRKAAAPASTGTTEAAPESRFASDAEVTTGLKALAGVAQGISQQQDEAASKKASEGLEPIWMKVEGTVKRNEPDIYATIEEDLSLLGSGDAAKTRTGADEMSKNVDAYLAKHPG